MFLRKILRCVVLLILLNIQISYGAIILLNGPTCAGKSSIAKELLELLSKSKKWECVALDQIISKSKLHRKDSDDGKPREKLHKNTLNFIKNNVKKENNIILDTVLDRKEDFDFLRKELLAIDKQLVCVFVYCPFEDSVKHLEIRNKLKNQKEQRSFFQLLHAFGKFYKKSNDLKKYLLILKKDSFEENCKKYIKRRSLDRLMWSLTKQYPIFDNEKDVPLELVFGEKDYNLILDSSKNKPEKYAEIIIEEYIKRFI
ncbi:AAA family ATPase [Candidatus Dependentiae bacterium]